MGDSRPLERTRVLVVDDDPPVRTALRRALERRSWTVLEAGSCQEAMRLLTGDGAGHFDLVVIDVVLEDGMSGLTLAESVLRQRPSLPILFISGYVDLEVKLESAPGAVTDFVGKPMSLTQLLRKADDLLARARGAPARTAYA